MRASCASSRTCRSSARSSGRSSAPSAPRCSRRVRGASDGGIRVAGHDLTRDEVLVERDGKDGWAVAASDGLTVALDLQLDDELVRAGRVYDLIHGVNTMRKEAGLELTDRIELTIPDADSDLLEHSEWIARETLATSVEVRRAPSSGWRRPNRSHRRSTSCRASARPGRSRAADGAREPSVGRVARTARGPRSALPGRSSLDVLRSADRVSSGRCRSSSARQRELAASARRHDARQARDDQRAMIGGARASRH